RFLLTDTHLDVQSLGFLERLVIVAGHRVSQVLVYVDILRQNRHQGETIIAGRAKRPEPLHVGNCHNSVSLAEDREPRTGRVPSGFRGPGRRKLALPSRYFELAPTIARIMASLLLRMYSSPSESMANRMSERPPESPCPGKQSHSKSRRRRRL